MFRFGPLAASADTCNDSGRVPMKTEEERLSFKYGLSYEEAFDAFLLLAARGRKRNRDITAAALIVLAAVLTVLYALNPYKVEYFLLAGLALATFGGVAYYPTVKARSGARRVAGARGIYKVGLSSAGYIRAAGGADLELAGDKDARAFETETLFVLRPDRQNTFCLPKRIMTEREIGLTRSIVAGHVKKFIRTDSQTSRP